MNPLMNPVGSKAEGKLNCINAVVITQSNCLICEVFALQRNSASGEVKGFELLRCTFCKSLLRKDLSVTRT